MCQVVPWAEFPDLDMEGRGYGGSMSTTCVPSWARLRCSNASRSVPMRIRKSTSRTALPSCGCPSLPQGDLFSPLPTPSALRQTGCLAGRRSLSDAEARAARAEAEQRPNTARRRAPVLRALQKVCSRQDRRGRSMFPVWVCGRACCAARFSGMRR